MSQHHNKADPLNPLPVEEELHVALEPQAETVRRIANHALNLPKPRIVPYWGGLAAAAAVVVLAVGVFWLYTSFEKRPEKTDPPHINSQSSTPQVELAQPGQVSVSCDGLPAHEMHRCFNDDALAFKSKRNAGGAAAATVPTTTRAEDVDDDTCPQAAGETLMITNRCGPMRALGPKPRQDFKPARVFSVGSTLVMESATGELAVWNNTDE